MTPPTRSENIHDLAVMSTILRETVIDSMSLAIDHEGRPAVVVPPSIAEQIHCLAREVCRRVHELARELEE